MSSRLVACASVRGKPSSRKEAEVLVVHVGLVMVGGEERKVASPASSPDDAVSVVSVAVEQSVMKFDFGVEDSSQPRRLSSLRIRRSIRSSETKPPAFIVLSTLMPDIQLVMIFLVTIQGRITYRVESVA